MAVSIKVRNPEYYWSKKEIEESNQSGEMSYEEWKALHSEDTHKHYPSYTFRFDYEVVEPVYPDGKEYELTIIAGENQEIQKIKVSDVTVVEFVGKSNKSCVVVSNDILHQFIKAKKEKGKTYWYFYIKENSEAIALSDTVWLSKSKGEEIFNQVGDFGVLRDEHVEIRKRLGYL